MKNKKIYKAIIQLGWDKSFYRTFNSITQAEQWLDKEKLKYQAGQIIDRRIVYNS